MRAQKGITLVALIITIIVLLILAMVAIGSLTGDHGIVTEAEDATAKYQQKVDEEAANLTAGEGVIANKLNQVN